ncbi:transglutaminase domain-containing protein [Clostridium sp. C105KSO13]|uniref:transglutaminase domain-containing protein n=1 Tax=Clostridium sp. C105KSO13 TaxID=1776045 RepID=UPI0007407000|nr:transglutaminase domain-containing protein [Clostridium sp. C105KSO13]CUX30958.1 Transglutaminase-like superfamily protein [Clostridium sp. C105KSO13]
MANRRKRRKRKEMLTFLGALLIICILSGMGTAALKQFPGIFISAKEVVETVKLQAGHEESVPFEEIKVPDDVMTGGYYYQQLTNEEQKLYTEIYQGILESSDSIYVHSSNVETLKKVSSFIFCDRPELFWCGGEMQMTSYADYSEIQPVYLYTGEEKKQRQSRIDKAVNDCLSGITGEMTEYDKVRYIFEYLVDTVGYNLEAPDNQNIYSALVGKSSVCAGYSRAAQYLLQKLGIECIYVTGTIPEQGAHAWNIVKCGGQYYQMDVTFGDPVFLEAESGENIPDKSTNYDYLCCSDAEILKNHTMDTEVSYPACSSMDLNYYKLNGMYYEEFHPEQLLEDMNQTIYKKESSFTCKFASDTLYQQAHDGILNGLVQNAAQNLLEHYELETVQYTYVEDDVMDKITIFWNYQ